ncbi:replication protein, putative [Oceanicola granulosus HTCC2516]|uniref:Replication protein, putative n=2 Tax=Oceanicola granulosus TaxID=252302 RepID=Q2CGP9_OCEGH|nr:replication protein, putative [Oceanicola granulosus HTCC2516]
MFDIELPEDDAPAAAPETKAAEPTFPAGKVSERRGPMASAITEASTAARERQEVEAKIRAENDALAHELVRLKKLGLVVETVPLDAIHSRKLVRDRSAGLDYDLRELKVSIAEIGLSNPIRLERAGDGYELIQGYRRLSAYRELLEETGEERFAAIPAAVAEPGEGAETLYRRMVDENLVRKDISFGEMAQLALDYAADPATACDDPHEAVAQLYKSAGYQKRSYIRNFLPIVERLGKHLKYLPDLPRSLGLELARKMEEVEGIDARIQAELQDWETRSVKDELTVLRRIVEQGRGVAPAPAPDASKPSKARTSFQFDHPAGRARCTASNGRLEVRLERDFSTIDRRKLEAAVQKLLDGLG